MHDSGENVLLTTNNLHGGLVGIGIKLFCKFIAAVIVEVSGVHIKDQLTVDFGIVFQTTGGDDAISLHLFEHFCVAAVGLFVMDIPIKTLWYNIRVGIGFLFPLIVPLGIGDFGSGQVLVSCYGTVNPVVSCHRAPFC